jgi:cytidylate kinase
MNDGQPSESGDRGLVVALDGPASSGKSSVGAAVATRLGYRFCDTGLLYRAITWLALRRAVQPEETERLVALVPEVQLLDTGDGRLANVSVDGEDVTALVHVPEVDTAVSLYAQVPELRLALLDRQRELAARGRIIMAGRDIGTVILPDAEFKLYLDASAEERARRRTRERGIDPDGPEAAEILDELERRDELDSNRESGPLRRPTDAVVIRTDGNAFEETVALVEGAIRTREAELERTPQPTSATDSDADDRVRRSARARRSQRKPIEPTPIATTMNPLRTVGSWILRVIARLIVRLRIEGDVGAIPASGPMIIASNHASSADPVLIGAFLNGQIGRPLNWLGKRELVEIPVIGWFFRQAGIHPVDRAAADVEAFRTAMRILESGNILAVFPEGTRSRDGALQEVRDGTAVLALRSGAPVMPAAVVDSDLTWPRGRMLPRPGRVITVRYGVPFRVAEEIPAAILGDRKLAKAAATRLIMSRIAELLPPRQRGVYASPNGVGGPDSTP